MKVLIIDNYDSFTFNLYHYVQALNVKVDVLRNDELDWDIVNSYDKIILSPGPGLPMETTNMMETIKRYHESKSILGICLGFQGLAEFFGGRLVNQAAVKHGVTTHIKRSEDSFLFQDLPFTLEVGLYHSWKVDETKLGDQWNITATSAEGVVMAIEHKKWAIYGVQFHPESIMTEHGMEIMRNFLFKA